MRHGAKLHTPNVAMRSHTLVETCLDVTPCKKLYGSAPSSRRALDQAQRSKGVDLDGGSCYGGLQHMGIYKIAL
jgi:hypothetical protein